MHRMGLHLAFGPLQQIIHQANGIIEVIFNIRDQGFYFLFVVDGDQRVIGVLSNREILKFLVDSLSDPKDEAEGALNDSRPWELGNLIQRKPITAEKVTAIAGVAVAMTTYSVSCLPVLDEQQRLVGSVGINELLRHLGRQLDAAPEEEFCLFTPKQEAKKPQTPAFFRKANGALVIPKANVAENVEVQAHCVLGFDQPTGRVLVKFIKEQEAGRGRSRSTRTITSSTPAISRRTSTSKRKGRPTTW